MKLNAPSSSLQLTSQTLKTEVTPSNQRVWLFLSLVCALMILGALVACFWPSGARIYDCGIRSYYWVSEKVVAPGRRMGSSLFTYGLVLSAIVLHKYPQLLARLIPYPRAFVKLAAAVFATGCALWMYFHQQSSLVAAVLILLYACASKFLHGRMLKTALWILIGVAVIASVFPGLLVPPIFKSGFFPIGIHTIEAEYSQLVTSADRLAAGFHLFSEVNCRYGVFFTVLLGFIEKFTGMLNFGQSIWAVRLSQGVFFLTAVFLYLAYAKKCLPAAAAAILLLAPIFATSSSFSNGPPTTAWRFFAFAIAAAFLLYAGKNNGSKLWFSAGAVGGIAILMNLEVALAVNFGFFLYLLFTDSQFSSSLKAVFRGIATYLFGIAAALSSGIILFFICFGSLPSFSGLLTQFAATVNLVRLGATAYSAYEFDPLLCLILCHCGYVLLKYATRRPGSLTSRNGFRLAVAMMNLMWISYYVNMPVPPALSANTFLYGFLLIDLLQVPAVRRPELWFKSLQGHTVAKLNALGGVLMCIFVASVFARAIDFYDRLMPRLSADCSSILALVQTNGKYVPEGMSLLSGLWVPTVNAVELERRGAFLKSNRKEGEFSTYISLNNVLMQKLSGAPSKIPLDDPYYDPVWNGGIEQYVRKIVAQKPQTIFLEAPEVADPSGASRRACLEYWRLLISSSYSLSESKDGWEIWHPSQGK